MNPGDPKSTGAVPASSASTSCLQGDLLAALSGADGLLPSVATVKRFVERWLADDALRQAFQADPERVAGQHGVPAEVHGYLERQEPLAEANPPALRAYGRYLEQRRAHRERMRAECAPVSAPWRAWRERQIQRCQGQLPAHYDEAILHLPVAFELCQGCSVGCWFCGLSAARLESVFAATEPNRELWRQTLEALRDVAGPAAGRGIAFWATDPLDNPEYETLCQDFHRVLGRFPATTTALGSRDLDRTQRLLELSWAGGCEFNRFSILNLKQMDALTAHFPPEALLYVDLIPQTRGALRAKAQAGRARQRAGAVRPEPATIACVSGFLVNMPARTVRLISPCEASERWPEGYRVHASATFADAGELRREIGRMVAEVMREAPPRDRPVRLRSDLTATSVVGGVALASPFGPVRRFPLSELALRCLAEGRSSGADLALELEAHGEPMAETFHALNLLFEAGCLDEEPDRG